MTSRPVASSGPVSYEPDVIRAAWTLLFMANTGTNSHNHHRTIPKHLSLDIDIADENLLEYNSEGVESRSTKSTRTTYSLESSQVIPENTPEELTMNSSGRRARQSVATGRDAEGRDSIPTMPSTPQKNSYQRPSRTPSSQSARRGVRRRESMSDLPPEPPMKPSEVLKQQRAKVTDNTCRIATDVESLYNEWMEKAGGDHNKAAGFWFEKQEQKSQSLWPTLEKCEAFVEAMKKDGWMRRRMVVEEDEVGEYHPAQKPKGRFLPLRIRNKLRNQRASAALLVDPKRQASAAERASRMLETERLVPSTASRKRKLPAVGEKTPKSRKSPSAPSGEQLASTPTSQDVEVLSTKANGGSPPAPGLRKRCRRSEADHLESNLGSKWTARVTGTGRRPCAGRHGPTGASGREEQAHGLGDQQR